MFILLKIFLFYERVNLMIPYIIMFIMLLNANVLIITNVKNRKKIYCIFICIVLIIYTGLRDISLGMNDTKWIYLPSWRIICETRWENIFMLSKLGISNLSDIGFVIFCKTISIISSNDHWFVFAICIPFYVIASRFIYKYSKNPCLSFLVLLSMNYFTGSFYLLRHMLALAFITLALDLLIEEKVKTSIICTLIASTIHYSAFLFIVAYQLAKIKLNRKTLIMLMPISLLAGTFGSKFYNQLVNILLNYTNLYVDHYLANNDLNFGYTWLAGAFIYIICLYGYDRMISDEKNKSYLLYNLSFCNLLCLGCMSILGEFSRIAMFFGISNFVLLPNSICAIKNKYLRYLIIGICVIVLSTYWFYILPKRMVVPYEFFF